MISQAELKRLRALQQKKFRGESGRFLVQGRKVVVELLQSACRVETILGTEEAAAWIRPEALPRKVPVQILASHELDKIGTFEKGNELIAIAITPDEPAFRAPAAGELMFALDGVRDPRNMGGLLRIADWFGVKRVLCSHDCMEVYNPKAVQSTMGSLFHLEIRHANLASELTQLAAAGTHVFVADMDGTPVYEAKLARPAVLVLGSESHGLSQAVSQMSAKVISIPRLGSAESLNVAMAAAALCTEFARQAGTPQAG
ncbi:MAG: methyltransferase [Myxococcaceae bacterium]|nr:methyltransferase [Myxococcaceae bacterium]